MCGASFVRLCGTFSIVVIPHIALAATFQTGVQSTFPTGLFYAAGADISHDGVLDVLAVGDNGALYVATGTGDGHFGTPVSYPVGLSPVSVTTGDVNGDGWADAVVPNWSGHSVSVLLGAANGTLVPQPEVQTGTNPRLALLVDVNADGLLDLAVSDEATTGKVTVLLGAGNGTFPTRVDVSTGDRPYGICAADFDHDGHLDLATADGGLSRATVLYGDGTGHFPRRYDTGVIPGQMVGIGAGDLDGDGWTDLVLSCSRSSSALAVLRGLPDGTFTAWSASYDFPAPGGVGQLVVTAVDGDSLPDVLVTGANAALLTLYHAGGAGILTAREDFTTPLGALSVCAARLNSDASMDALVAFEDPNTGAGGTVAFLQMQATGIHREGRAVFAPQVTFQGERLLLNLTLDSPARVRLAVYDARGRRLADVLDTDLSSGAHAISYEFGQKHPIAARGIYLVWLSIGHERRHYRIVFV